MNIHTGFDFAAAVAAVAAAFASTDLVSVQLCNLCFQQLPVSSILAR